MSRISARENLMKLVFDYGMTKNEVEDMEDLLDTSFSGEDKDYIVKNFEGIKENYNKIVSKIESNLIGYKLDRICKTDLAILVVAIYEIVYLNEPTKVIINEAVELAKKYSTENSYKFVNGLLGKIVDAI